MRTSLRVFRGDFWSQAVPPVLLGPIKCQVSVYKRLTNVDGDISPGLSLKIQ